ncbi:hypothetical protein PICSAR26_04638 [Mycobacterium avium subsp. paratuberculosis]|nr:hypothetical protein PICSAR26_04638 [Mycobacterium avium subsp. paratuberculosis]
MVVNRRRPVTIYEVYNGDSGPLRAAKRAAQPAFDEAFALFDAVRRQRLADEPDGCRIPWRTMDHAERADQVDEL